MFWKNESLSRSEKTGTPYSGSRAIWRYAQAAGEYRVIPDMRRILIGAGFNFEQPHPARYPGEIAGTRGEADLPTVRRQSFSHVKPTHLLSVKIHLAAAAVFGVGLIRALCRTVKARRSSRS